MEYFADLHVHVGSAKRQPVKITASRALTLESIFHNCIYKKGIDIVGIVDCASPPVIKELNEFIEAGDLSEIPGGGLSYKEKLTVFLGAEIETDEGTGAAHNVAFFRDVQHVTEFSNRIAEYITNINLSSQRARMDARKLLGITQEFDGLIIPAHVFTPFKSFYGKCYDRMADAFPDDYDNILAVELGLSADTYLADTISELSLKSFLSNSDAHSVDKIAREYNKFELKEASLENFISALLNKNENHIVANCGLDPRLGKYHRTLCLDCNYTAKEPPPVLRCPICKGGNLTVGVLDRITQIADLQKPVHPPGRPPYHHHIPLEFIPGIGRKTMERLIRHFGNEMTVIHKSDFDDLKQAVGEKVAKNILDARNGRLGFESGGGGIYGKIITHK